MVRDLNEQEFDAAVAEKKVSLIDFWAPWCGPCRMTGPQVEAAAEELDGKASFFKVNVDDNPGLARQFGVMSIPTLIVLQSDAPDALDRLVDSLESDPEPENDDDI